MANTRFEYVKGFEQIQTILPNTYIVVRLDGRAFHKVSQKYEFEKPNDRRALDLMNDAATSTMLNIPEIRMGYGVSDEYSFVMDRSTQLFGRRESKLLTTIVSTFTAHYVHDWPCHFETTLTPPLPSFDGRVVAYPSLQNLRDYLSWRQADCHINNLYNTTFWALVVRGGLNTTDAETKLKGTLASDKNEILFERFKLNYNEEPAIFRKGTVCFRARPIVARLDAERSDRTNIKEAKFDVEETKSKKHPVGSRGPSISMQHCDIIKDSFWKENSALF